MKKYGLDFGTTNSAIAIESEGVGKVLEIDLKAPDPRVIRTMLYFYPRTFVASSTMPLLREQNNVFYPDEYHYEGEVKSEIGYDAVNQYLEDNRHRTPGLIRTFLTGRHLSVGSASEDQAKGDVVAERYEEIDYGTGRLVQGLKTGLKSPNFKGTKVFGEFLTLEELIARFVQTIKDRADLQIEQGIDEVVVGRPVHFSDDQEKDKATQNRLEEALKIVGFKQISFEFEPVAAAKQFIAYSKKQNARGAERLIAQSGEKSKLVFVFDFGGGTLDTAIVRSSEVLAADGVYIGGDLLNADIMQGKLWDYFGASSIWSDARIPVPRFLYETLGSWISIPNLNNPETMELLGRIKYKNSDKEAIDRLIYLIKSNVGFQIYEAIEIAKKQLSTQDSAQIIYQDGPIDINVTITKAEFEGFITHRVEEIRNVVLRTLQTAGVEASEIDVVVRTGGSSLIPVFETMLIDIFGREKIKQFDTFTSIAAGLAL